MRRFKALFALAMIAAATSMAVAASALATDEYYPSSEGCGKCAQTSGPDNYIVNNESYNFSGEGFCDAAYINEGGGSYSLAFEKCYSSGKGTVLCYGSGEFYGHGQTRRYFSAYEYNLVGRQDNFKYCG